jgi:hypothetical protein
MKYFKQQQQLNIYQLVVLCLINYQYDYLLVMLRIRGFLKNTSFERTTTSLSLNPVLFDNHLKLILMEIYR